MTLRESGMETNNIFWKKRKCGGDLIIDVGDCIRDGEFQWFVSSRCRNCGDATEMDRYGF